MRYQENPKQKLEQAVAALRAERPDAGDVQAAGERVWQRLSTEMQNGHAPQFESIHGCGDVRALLIQYHAGQLSPARALLVRDHLNECPGCRKEAEKSGKSAGLLPWSQELSLPRPHHFRWLAAAAAVVIAAAGIYIIQNRVAVPEGSRAQVESVNGALYLVSQAGETPLQPGQEIREGERVRTSGGSRAMLRLRDGSLVEMNEHAEFSVGMRRQDTTINLGRGDIIVQAAKRHTGHLYVAAQDCLVSVTGTVFSVNSGIKGSRVSVIEGEVRVTESGATQVLHPGDQLSTNSSVAAVPVPQEISWSQNSSKHLALLAEFVHLQNKMEQKVQLPGLRYESRLLPLLPQSTVLYAGIPNYGEAIQQAGQLFQQELQESDVLREWWQQAQANRNGPGLEEVLQKLHELGQYLGNEIVFSVSMTSHGAAPLVIAQVQKPGLREFIEQLLAQTPAGKHGSVLRLLGPEDLAVVSSPTSEKGLLILVRPDFVVVSHEISALRDFNAQLDQGSAGLAATSFGQRLQQAYTGGTGLLFAADLRQMESQLNQRQEKRALVFQQTGFADLKYLVAERKDVAGQTVNQAELTFNGPRHGLASWLAAPAPIGGLDYVSANAAAVGAIVTKSGGAEFDDLTNIAGAIDPNFGIDLAKAETTTKINFKQDLAGTLGGELVIAVDGPLLPTPSWKVIAEVYDPARLERTLEQLAADAGSLSGGTGEIKLEKQAEGGLTYYTLHFSGGERNVEVDYTFTDGYLIIGPSRALVMDAVRIHQGGNSLARSQGFHALLPHDQFANVSALLYQNLAPVLGPVAQQLTAQQLQAFKALAAETRPSMVCAYGEENAIRVASNSRFFGLDLNTLALSALLKLSKPPGAPGDRVIH
jgi:hypothetical protein